jgi:hypothetical protein
MTIRSVLAMVLADMAVLVSLSFLIYVYRHQKSLVAIQPVVALPPSVLIHELT